MTNSKDSPEQKCGNQDINYSKLYSKYPAI